MKKFGVIGIVCLLLLLCGCEFQKENYYLIATADNNYNVFFNSDNKTLSSSERIAYNNTITVSWMLLPQSLNNVAYVEDNKGNITDNSKIQVILEPDNYLQIIHLKDISTTKTKETYSDTKISFKAIAEGDTKITIKSESYGSATVHINSIKIK